MRRVVAILMSLLFSLLLITPAFSAPSRELPECCKRAGKHHCSMDRAPVDGPTLTREGCAQFQWQGSTVLPQHFDVASPVVRFSPPEAVPATLSTLGTEPDLSRAPTMQSRGPPASDFLRSCSL